MIRRFFLLAVLALQACASTSSSPSLQPAAAQTSVQTIALDAAWRGTLPVTIVAPANADGPLPLILFSTGALSSPDKYMAMLKPWALAGYIVVAPLHVDSEAWTGAKPAQPTEGLAWRLRDFTRLVDALPALERQTGLTFDTGRVAATGHSFGGMIAQILGGAKPGSRAGNIGPLPALPIAAVVAVSPPGPIPDYIEAAGWGQMQVPHLLTTGTGDVVQMIAPEWQDHLAGHQAHPSVSFALVGEGADHYYGNVIGRTEYPGPAQQAPFDEMLVISKLFLGAFVRGDEVMMSLLMSRAARGPAERVGLNAK